MVSSTMQSQLQGLMLSQPLQVSELDVTAINSLSKAPLIPVTPETIYVRRCRLAGDAIDSRMGRFHTEDLPKLLEMLQGVPVMVGHQKNVLPIARFFGGLVEKDEKSGVSYVTPQFYWMREHSQAKDLLVNLNGGIYNEASISFMYGKPACSECSKDIRYCEHLPGKRYGEKDLCHVWYEELAMVLEGSIVFRGAQPGTRFDLTRLWANPQIAEQYGYTGIQPWEV